MFFFFFFLMIRRPPRSTLFPTRRSSDLCTLSRLSRDSRHEPHNRVAERRDRSEEHTSELQSHHDLVCRLLLEKKKKKKQHDKNNKPQQNMIINNHHKQSNHTPILRPSSH